MKCLRALVVLIFLISSLIGINCGDDKSANNPANDIPASLVGTWWYHSGIQDGVPIGLFAEIDFTDTSEAGSTTSNANATWSGAEFYDNQVVFTQSGTFTVNNDILKITRVIFNDDPADPNDTSSALWGVIEDTLDLTSHVHMVSDAIIVIVRYLKE